VSGCGEYADIIFVFASKKDLNINIFQYAGGIYWKILPYLLLDSNSFYSSGENEIKKAFSAIDSSAFTGRP
jgi:hypothetical protein